jgi:hypothetical protein
MAGVFQNIDPTPPSPPGECVPSPLVRGGGTHSLGGEGGGGSIIWNVSLGQCFPWQTQLCTLHM